MAPVTRRQKRKADDENVAVETVSPPKSPPQKGSPTHTSTKNQPLVQALHDLSDAMLRAAPSSPVHSRSNRFKGLAVRRAANALADLDYEIVAGASLAAPGPHKVSGVGSGIAAYIDEFLETGQIYEIVKYQAMTKSKTPEPSTTQGDSATSSTTTLQINRAPVLALWVTVVAEQEGFHRDEALTYGQWVSGTLARSKGKSLGFYQEGEKTDKVSKKPYEKVNDDSTHVVKAFGRMKIPIVCKNGQRLAVQGRKVIDPVYVQDYLERSFGDQLDSVQVTMRMLASSLSVDDLQMRCYHLYEEFRPAWKGWGQNSTLDLSKMRDLFAGNA